MVPQEEEYMDDLKIYASTPRELDALIGLVSDMSKEIGMEFGYDKCRTIAIEKGVIDKHETCKTVKYR